MRASLNYPELAVCCHDNLQWPYKDHCAVCNPMKMQRKTLARHRYEQFIYWSSIGWDVVRPGKSPGVFVLGYIKSGTNWLCKLVADVLDLPLMESWLLDFPILTPCVYHMHRFIPLDSARRRTIYLMRDGRDTVVSGYFHLVREGGVVKDQFDKALGRISTPENIKENLPEYIRFMQTNRIASTDYRSHLNEWKKHKDVYITAKYEDLLEDTARELTRIVTELRGVSPSASKVREVVEKHDFSRVTKRKRGDEDAASFIRKGISGDWKNYFSSEAANLYDEYAGDLLIELGYERDRSWVGVCE